MLRKPHVNVKKIEAQAKNCFLIKKTLSRSWLPQGYVYTTLRKVAF